MRIDHKGKVEMLMHIKPPVEEDEFYHHHWCVSGETNSRSARNPHILNAGSGQGSSCDILPIKWWVVYTKTSLCPQPFTRA